eukprot:403341981
MLKILLECFTLFIILLYSVLSTFYLISQLLLNLAFLVFIIPNSPSSRLLLDVWNFILGIAITLGHYYFILICMTATRKLTKLSDKLFKHTLPGYLKIKSFSKNARIISLFVHFIQIVYMMQILKSYWDPKQKSISSGNNKSGNNQSELTEEYDQISKYIIGCLIWINVGQFVNQVLVTFNGMILMAFYLAFQTLGCCGPEDTYDEIDETNESQPEDIFQFLETRIEELKFKYKNLQRRFAKKNKTISKMCIICFEEFHADTEEGNHSFSTQEAIVKHISIINGCF